MPWDEIEKEKLRHCNKCRFAVEIKTNIVGRWFAECRRFPPQILISKENIPVIGWPQVNDAPALFCYEFKDKEGKEI